MMANKTLIKTALTVVCLLSFHAPAYSGVYKWVDDDGQIHYSDQPNKPDAAEFSIRNNTTTKPRAMKPAESSAEKAGPGATEASPETPAKPEMVEIELSNNEKKQLCNQAKSDIASISSRGRMREINAKGEYSYLSEEQRQKRLSAAQKKQRKYCR